MTLDTHGEMRDIVLGGARAQAGMPNFEDSLSNEQLEAIRAFTVNQARQLRDYQQGR